MIASLCRHCQARRPNRCAAVIVIEGGRLRLPEGDEYETIMAHPAAATLRRVQEIVRRRWVEGPAAEKGG